MKKKWSRPSMLPEPKKNKPRANPVTMFYDPDYIEIPGGIQHLLKMS